LGIGRALAGRGPAAAGWVMLALVVSYVDLVAVEVACGYRPLFALPGSIGAAGLAWWALLRKDRRDRRGAFAFAVHCAATIWAWAAVAVTTALVALNLTAALWWRGHS